ncbi:MAG: phosphoserine phosphatase SerB [Phycisphaeraceae bacterium]
MPHTLHITGPDHPGITAAITAALGDTRILDLNQAVIHQSVLLAMVVDADELTLKNLHRVVTSLGMTLTATPLSDHDYNSWRAAEGKPRYILTLIARTLTADKVHAVSLALAAHHLNIDVITRLSGRPPLTVQGTHGQSAGGVACVEMVVRGDLDDPADLKAAFLDLSRDHAVDIAWQVDNAFRRIRRLVAFDMDSTLIQHEVIDELAIEAGVGDQVAAVTEAAMRGELDFEQSLRQRVGLLEGLPESALQIVANRLNLTEGAETLITNLRHLGYKTAILSGGFNYFGDILQQKLGIDHVAANQLEIINGQLTGNVLGQVVDAQRKAQLLGEIAAREGIRLEQTIAVGDGANDLPMLARAGLGIAFHAKPLVQQSADQKITTLGLDAILYLIGMRDSERLRSPSVNP